MKTKTINPFLVLIVAGGFWSSALDPVHGSEMEISAAVFASGGQISTSSDQRFQLTGTVGQGQAGPVSVSADQRFSLESGFWSGITVIQTPEAPHLSIRGGRPGTVVISWPIETTGYVLEETENLTRPNWKTMLLRIVDTETEHTVTVPIGGMRCFRLRKL